jgi:hypothetical protein
MRLRDPGVEDLKTDLLMDPLCREPRYQAIERALKFPTEYSLTRSRAGTVRLQSFERQLSRDLLAVDEWRLLGRTETEDLSVSYRP